MKKYDHFGELLLDYRSFMQISQADFAAQLQVDPRTIQRWERNETLIKPNKEPDIAEVTLFPYQVIRNLNSPDPIPTYYDLHLRKYALNEIGVEMPDADWFRDQLDKKTERLVKINFEKDFDYLLRFMEMHRTLTNTMKTVIEEGIKIAPEINNILNDDSGYYAAHSIVLPITQEAYLKLRTKQMKDVDLQTSDLANYKSQELPIFFAFDITADCNENFYHIINPVIHFLQSLPNQEYTYCSIPYRHDNYELSEKAGLKIIWEDEKKNVEKKGNFSRRFIEGNFTEFLLSGD
ncbi:helix-turn-helix domain-containing protein [Namhaeicola litoreus]|uniref:Helix-turn-helix domain-containing protein n=1 Tax=Namhaeicola litoreus TaxID=1052145 RepID=A0ABW3Y2E3_9FLAO